MCYDIKAQLETQLRRAMRDGDEHAIEEIMEKLAPLTDLPLYHSKGFGHPSLLIYTDEDPYFPQVSTWGLVPEDAEDKSYWNNTLNARGETIFSKPSFRESAKKRRCLIYCDAFYEHHHFKGKTYPFLIKKKDNEPMALAGLWSVWKDYNTGGIWNTFAIVTTKPNPLMAKLHNNPKAKDGPRMPLILPTELENEWIQPYDEALWEKGQKKAIHELIQSYPEEKLDYYTVGRLGGKEYVGNIPEISEPLNYPELVF
ncbi:SOS response-associated peptidase [Ulvibacterium marinum]|uniref:Abasic site processing protein n=1 Tax=Ulvibacterium marinum TaxID=2419782 RepID=A0A3B0CAI7_9FLAO|nr:SOS response-associated peptidase [Ulvibacterium marinum]RKN83515.1 SOS response-associated peptidase [Ulvibacterium marinum]